MDWDNLFTKPTVLIGAVVLVVLATTTLQIATNNQKNTDTRTRASFSGSKTIVVAKADVTGIQQSINSANDGDIIQIPPGQYSGPQAIPITQGNNITVSKDRGAVDTCFIHINGKNITLNAPGVTFFGEGHDKPYMDPYQFRGGLCIINSKVTIVGLRIKEFQRRALVAYNSQVVFRNGVVDGNDEGGISLLGNTTALILNNIICCHNNGGVLLWNDANAKIINNTFYDGGVTFHYHFSGSSTIKAEITNNIFTQNSFIFQTGWWPDQFPKVKNNKITYNLIYKTTADCGVTEFCDPFPGKISADPQLEGPPVTDPRGWHYGSFEVKAGSPAINSGSPQIPGPNKLGYSGGPCADANSTICTNFINNNFTLTPTIPVPTPTPENTAPTPTTGLQTTPTPTLSVVNTPTLTIPSSTGLPTNTPAATSTPRPTATPTVTPYPTTGAATLPKTPPDPFPQSPICLSPNDCPTRRNGDANCDKAINEADFTAWKFQFDTISVLPNDRNANFLCLEGNSETYFVDLTEFELWRRNAKILYTK